MTNKGDSMTLWQAIERLAQQVPFSKEKVEGALSTTLTLSRQSPATDFYHSEAIHLIGDAIIQDVDLRLNRAGKTAGFLSLPVGGTCVSFSDVVNRYPGLYQTDSPYIDSPDEEYGYTVDMPWGALQFGFNHRNRNCLTTVSFNTGARRKRLTLE